MTRRRFWRPAAITALVVGAYPAFVLGFTWGHVLASDLPGGRHGPLDAYRHALASAAVGYSLGEPMVRFASDLLEGNAKRSSSMDRHNNRIGAAIGASAASLSDLPGIVRARVARGAVEARDPEQITWLPEADWRSGRLW